MAYPANITRDDSVFLGEDKQLQFTIYTDATLAACQDVSGFTLSWSLAARPGATVALAKTLGSGISVTGTFNASPPVNTQRIVITLADTDTDAIAFGTWYHELKRTDAGLEAVLAQGTIYFHKPVHTA